MKVLDAGHLYALAHLDGDGETILNFVKREGPGYPGNVGHHEGTNVQEVCRSLIDRLKYLDGQIPDDSNQMCIYHLRAAIRLLEYRAARRHGRDRDQLIYRVNASIEEVPTCPRCGHIGCEDKHDL